MALLALAITDNTAIPNWLRFLMSPGWSVGLRLSSGEACGGILDCLAQVGAAVGRAAEIAWAVNAILYGLMIFGIATTVTVLRRNSG